MKVSTVKTVEWRLKEKLLKPVTIGFDTILPRVPDPGISQGSHKDPQLTFGISGLYVHPLA